MSVLCQNTASTTDDEVQLIVGELTRSIVNENRRANEAKRRSERQIKFRNKQLKEMQAMVTKLKTKLNNQPQKYRRVKKQLKNVVKSVEKSPKTRIEEMSEDITKKKELVKKALFGEVIKIQLEENYTEMKSHEDKTKFKQAISGNVVDKYKLWRIPNKAVTFKKAGYNQPKKCILLS